MSAQMIVKVEQFFLTEQSILWKAITNVVEMQQWFFDNIPDFKAEKGFKTQFDVNAGERHFLHIWEIIEVIPDNKLVYDWRYGGHLGYSKVTFEIRKQENGVVLTVEHRVIEPYTKGVPEFTFESCKEGWNYFIKKRLLDYLSNK